MLLLFLAHPEQEEITIEIYLLVTALRMYHMTPF